MPNKELGIIISGHDSGATQNLQRVRTELSGVGESAKAASVGFGDIAAGAAKLGLGVFGIQQLANAVVGLGGNVLAGNRQFEQFTVQFGVLLKSTDAAKARIEELQRVNMATPFQLDELVKADKVLTGYGLHSEEAAKAFGKSGAEMRMTAADVAAGTGQSMVEIAGYLGRFSQGAVGEAMQRFAELGITTRGELASMGVEFSKSGELVSPLDKAMKALLASMQDKFGGMADAQSKTFDGMLSNIQDWVSNTQRRLAEPLFDHAKDQLQALLDKLNSDEMNRAVDQMAEGISSAMLTRVIPAIQTVAFAFGALPKLIEDISAAMNTGEAASKQFGKALVDVNLPVVGHVGLFDKGVFGPIAEELGELGRVLGITGEQARAMTNEELSAWIQEGAKSAAMLAAEEQQVEAATMSAHKALNDTPPAVNAAATAWGLLSSYLDSVSGSYAQLTAKAQEAAFAAQLVRQADIDSASWNAGVKEYHPELFPAPASSGPKWSPPSMGGGSSGGKKGWTVKEAEIAYREAGQKIDAITNQLEYDTIQAGVNAGKAWFDGWTKADEAIRNAQEDARRAIGDLDAQEKRSREIRSQRQDLDAGLARASRIRQQLIENGEIELRYAKDVANLQMQSFDQKMRTADTDFSRRQQDASDEWQRNRELAKAKTDDEKKQINERFKEERKSVAFRRKQEDEARAWSLSQEKKRLEEQHRQALADLAGRRKQEDDDREFAKQQEGIRQRFDDNLRDQELVRQKARIEEERDAKITAANKEWEATQKRIKEEQEAKLKSAREEATGKLAALRDEYFEKMKDAAAPGMDSYIAMVNAKLAGILAAIPGGAQEWESSGPGEWADRNRAAWEAAGSPDYNKLVWEGTPGYQSTNPNITYGMTNEQKADFNAANPSYWTADAGGTVPGPLGARRLVVARGGEEFGGYPPRGGRSLTINVSGNTMLADESRVARELARILKPELDRIVGGAW